MNIGRRILFLFGVLVVLLLIASVVPGRNLEGDLEFCTQEARRCNDGSFVGRSGPSCDFAVCENEKDDYQLKPMVSKEGNIRVYGPVEYQKVSRPIIVSGEARVFENTFLYAIKDGDGNLLANGFSTANAPDVGQFGPFVISLWYDERPELTEAVVEVYNQSVKDGSVENLVSIPVLLSSEEAVGVKAFFGNSKIDPMGDRCNSVYPVVRAVKKTQDMAKVALEILLRGPTASEKALGYFTSIDEIGVEVQDLTIEDEVARVDFSEELNKISGSCKVEAVKAQIENTISQFDTVKSVVILVDGSAEEVLQP